MKTHPEENIHSGLEPGPGEEIPKQDWPIGPLQDIPPDEAEQENPNESAKRETNKKPDKGNEEWPSVSWP